jgi:hypothetical protein
MEQLVDLVRWLRKLTKNVKIHKGNTPKDILCLRFSKMGLSSDTAPDTIVANKMEADPTLSAGRDEDVQKGA